MKILRNLRGLGASRGTVLLAIGFFDGVHRGHRKIIKALIRSARRAKASAWVLTFNTHPQKVLNPDSAPKLLTSTEHKLQLLAEMGIDGCVLMNFTRKLARQEPEAFVETLAGAAPNLRGVFVGSNWVFGRHCRGNAATLKMLGKLHGFEVAVIRPACWRKAPISSTRIRSAVAAGRLKEAALMLGRSFSILATVVPGNGLGRKLGVPTANLRAHNEVTPPNGVFIVRARLRNNCHAGVANLGIRPTLTRVFHSRKNAHPERVLELHIFGIKSDLYGEIVDVEFLKKIRNERAFTSLDALKLRIREDIATARKWLHCPKKNNRE